MASRILADVTASVTELQKDPMGTAASGNGATVAILKQNALAFYCVLADGPRLLCSPLSFLGAGPQRKHQWPDPPIHPKGKRYRYFER